MMKIINSLIYLILGIYFSEPKLSSQHQSSNHLENAMYEIDGGDGDQNFFGAPMQLVHVQADWFKGRVKRGKGKLLRVISGDYEGELVIITSRQIATIDEQLERSDYASVVVHLVRNPTKSFSGDENDADPIGMSVIQKL